MIRPTRPPLPARLLHDQRGGIAMLFGMLAMILCGFAAVAIDAGNLYVARTKLQGAASAAALAAVQDLPNTNKARAKAHLYAQKNMPVAEHGHVLEMADIVVGEWDPDARSFSAGGSTPNAVQVFTRRAKVNGNPVETTFASLMGFKQVDVTAEAIAIAANPPICVLALNPSANAAFNIGNGTLDANGCSVQVNSDDPTGALEGNPGGKMSAESICVNGGHSTKPTYSPDPETCEPRADPLAALDPPTVGGCDHPDKVTVAGSDDVTLSPGVYCGGISIATSGTVTFDSGLYVIKGTLSVSSQSTVVGEGVTFYVTEGGEVDITGGGNVTLKAATTGTYAGILFYGDRNLAKTNTIKFAGGGSLHYEGTIYFPGSEIKLAGGGNAASPSPYSVFIADTFSFSGNGTFAVNSDYGSSDVPPPAGLSGSAARLVM